MKLPPKPTGILYHKATSQMSTCAFLASAKDNRRPLSVIPQMQKGAPAPSETGAGAPARWKLHITKTSEGQKSCKQNPEYTFEFREKLAIIVGM
jgi:hypothetical protein